MIVFRQITKIVSSLILLSLFSCTASEFAGIDETPVQIESDTEIYSGMGGSDTLNADIRAETLEIEKTAELFYFVYAVQKGDIVGEIADRFNVSQDAIISLNRLKNTRTIQIGQLLKIPSMNGILYTARKGDTPSKIADSYQISLEKIAVLNNLTENEVTPGTILFLPDAKLDRITLQEINGDLFRKPIRSGYYVSSYYGWRNNPFSGARTFHNGIDMATSHGTSVFASLDGTVSKTGYDPTYGNFIIISHHSGYQSMYAHLSAILTSKGKYVTTASRIGLVGNTGQSTGSHLHFTIYKNRATMNPVGLWN